MPAFRFDAITISSTWQVFGQRITSPCILLFAACLFLAPAALGENAFPEITWSDRSPAECGVDAAKIIEVSTMLGGRGCVIKDGYVIYEWGEQAERGDWMSSAKPVLSTLLFFALQEGRIKSVDQRVSDFEKRLIGKDREITFRQLGSMTSGFRRPENPGEAWAYNDPAIQLYQRTLFDHVFHEEPDDVAEDLDRLGALEFEDGLKWSRDKRRLRASPRDFARIAWFWLNKGKWRDKRLLSASYFDEFARPQTPKNLAATQGQEGEDYLAIGSFGGGTDHFTHFGAGIYGFNWWFNDTGRLHPDAITWPNAPPDTFMAIGAGGNCAAIFPSLNMVLVCANGDWGKLDAGNAKSRMNRLLALASSAVEGDSQVASVSGELTKWRPVTIDFHGPSHVASDTDPNPFLDYRLQMRLTSPAGALVETPGFFAGDGEGGLSGDIWRVIFSPDTAGVWRYEVSFRKGKDIAVDDDPNAGSAAAFNGSGGGFEIQETAPSAQGFYQYGRLEYVGEHYFKLRDGPFWLKGGTDSPEDFLAYHGFINTPKARHQFASHVTDWNEGDPDWEDGRGKGIIGALNYLAAQNVNSIYLLPLNLGGDGKNVYPFLGKMNSKGSDANDNLHYDITKLRQWSIVFEHAQRRGMLIHFVLNEAEEANKRELDDGLLGVERKLFYRELIARFGHFPAIQWNLCEEYNLHHKFDPALIKEFAKYIADTDPYNHPITVHHAGRAEKAWAPFLGDPLFAATSFQERSDASKIVEFWRAKSRAAGHPLVIGMDEFFPDLASEKNAGRFRREYIWPVYFSGGGVELILDRLLKAEDFRDYASQWKFMAIAKSFITEQLPFWEMEPRDDLLIGAATFQGKNSVIEGQVFTKPGEIYAVYFPDASKTGELDLSNCSGEFHMCWFDPRAGKFVGGPSSIEAGKLTPLGSPPRRPSKDWVVLLQKVMPVQDE